MDTITHGLIGALAAKAGFSQKAGKAATIAFMLGAIFPDIDFVTSFLGPEYGMRYHRGITHSVFAAPFFALLVGAVVYRFSSLKSFWAMALMATLGIYSHIFFDLITSYGTVIFDPISIKRYAWNLVFILDPFITVPVIAGLVISWRRKDLALKASVIVFGFLAIYLLFCFYAREKGFDKLDAFARDKSLTVVRSSVYPRPLAPFFWMGVIETPDSFYKMSADLLDKESKVVDEIPKPADNKFIELAKASPIAKTYFWFAEFPVPSYRVEGGKHIVEFYDLRFGVVSNMRPFLLRMVFDDSGALTEVSLNRRAIEGPFSDN